MMLLKNSILRLFSFIIILTSINFARTQPGAIDPNFNTFDNGAFGDESGFNSPVFTSVVQADGKTLVGGGFTSFNGVVRNRIARLNINGSLDTTFDIGTGFNQSVLSMAIQPDGKIIVGGSFSTYNGVAINRIARLNTDGTLDTSFYSFFSFNGGISSIIVLNEGKILVAGGFSTYGNSTQNRIARLNSDGTLDNTFTIGSGFNNSVNTISLQADGKIMAGGQFTSFNGTTRNRIARLNANGSLDTSFNPGTGFPVNGNVNTISIQSDQKIVAGGAFVSFNGVPINRILRLNTDGTLDNSFNIGLGFSGFSDYVKTTSIQTDGKIIVGGVFLSYNGSSVSNITRLNSDGSFDTSFNPGVGFNNVVNVTVVLIDGRIFVGGAFTLFNGTTRHRHNRLNSDGTQDISYITGTGTGYNSIVFSTELQSDGKIIVAGIFESFNNISRNNIARLNSDGSLDNTFDPGSGTNDWVIATAIQPDGKIILCGHFTTYNGTSRNRIVRLNADGTIDPNFNIGTGFNNHVLSIAIQADGKIVLGGQFTSFNGTPRNRIARLNVDGTNDASFDIGTGFNLGGNVNALVIQTDGKIVVGGSFNTFNGTSVNRLVRLNTNGTLDLSFNIGSDLNEIVRALNIQADGKILIGGTAISINGTNAGGLARVNTDGSLDVSFISGTGFSQSVRAIEIQTDGKIVACGWFTSFNGITANRIARLNSDGTLDLTFETGSGFNTFTYAAAIQSDGKILVGGEFFIYNETLKHRIVRLLVDPCVPVEGVDVISSCSPVTWLDGNTYSENNNSATYNIIGGASNGCDSLVTLNLTINNSATGTDVIMANQPYLWIDGNMYSENNNTATYNFVGGAANGCDSLVTLNLTIDTNLIIACNSYTWIDGNTYTESNNTATYNIVGGGVNGSDSLVTLNLIINNSTTSTDVVIACESYTWIDGNTYTESNNSALFNIVGGAANGCDNLVSLNLTINNPTTGTDLINACDSYTWIDGNTYTVSDNVATYSILGGSANGCDSLVFLNLIISNSATGIDIITTCDSYTWIDGNTYTESNNIAAYNILGGAANGCDSLVTLNLTINNSSTSTDIVTACYSYTWIDGNTYTESNNIASYNILGGAANGCDSIVTLNLTINNSSTSTDIVTACYSFTWIDGITYTESNNIATYNIIGGASTGCDSIVTLNLTINNSTTGTDVINACGSLTWIDGVTYSESNNSATFNIVGGAANGCDSIVTLNLTINNSTIGTDVIIACDSFIWIDGVTYSESNSTATFEIVGGSANGCDSLVNLNLTINYSVTGTDNIAANDSITWIDGITYTESNNSATFNIVGGAANGCDSLVSLNLIIDNSTSGFYHENSMNYNVWFEDSNSNYTFDFIIVPNPSNGITTVLLSKTIANASYTIFDALGRIAHTGDINNTDNVRIDATLLNSGVYMILITVGNQQITKKLVLTN